MTASGTATEPIAEQTLAPDAPAGLPPGLPRRDALSLIAVPLVHGIGQSLLFAILPAVARDQGISENQVAMVYMLPAIAWSLMTAWWGHRCDYWDRKPILLLSVLGFAASMLVFAGAATAAYAGVIGSTTLWLLILASRLLYSGMSSGALPAAQAYAVERSRPHQRTAAISRVTAAWNFGTLLGPGIIGVLALFGVLTPLFAAAGFALLIWWLVRRNLSSQSPQPRPAGPHTRLSPFDPRIRLILITGLCGSMAQAILLQTLGFYFMDGLGISTMDTPRTVGVALVLAGFATLFSQVVLVPWLHQPAARIERIGIAINCIAFPALALSTTVTGAWAATALCGLGYGLLRPGNISRASLAVSGHEQGTVAGLNGALWSAGYILTPMFAMPLHARDPHLPFIAGAVILIVALAFNLMGHSQDSSSSPTSP